MERYEWRQWSTEQVLLELPGLIGSIEDRIADLPDDQVNRTRGALASLREKSPEALEIKNGSRQSEFLAVSSALAILGRRIAPEDVNTALQLFEAAYELARSTNPSGKPNKTAHDILDKALEGLLDYELSRAAEHEAHAGSIREELHRVTASALGDVSPQMMIRLDKKLMRGLETIHKDRELDISFHRQFIQDNIESAD